ncbi:hypothetical protein ANN_02519 [Periplaneta americana]|uniref:Uncharacterized protein n=1 Tax=Periplaneta americana TaxID=6978 RepID=A0ABQ8TZ14_PERAM|nr:hypothetical protein ANN_02519 [Periplaneta americana]
MTSRCSEIGTKLQAQKRNEKRLWISLFLVSRNVDATAQSAVRARNQNMVGARKGSWFRESHCDDTPLAGQRQIQMERSLTPVSERVGVVGGRKRIAIIASHNVLVSHIFDTAAVGK